MKHVSNYNKDTLKASLKAFNIDHGTWEQAAQNRGVCRSAVHKGVKLARPTGSLLLKTAGRPGRTEPSTLQHELPPFPVLTARDFSGRRLASPVICGPTEHDFPNPRMTRWSSSYRRRTNEHQSHVHSLEAQIILTLGDFAFLCTCSCGLSCFCGWVGDSGDLGLALDFELIFSYSYSVYVLWMF